MGREIVELTGYVLKSEPQALKRSLVSSWWQE
jgi:hypothetical protein